MRKSWAKHGSHVLVAAACGIIVSVAMFAITRQLERSRAEAHFVQVADQRLSSVRTHVAGALNTVSLLASHLESTGHEGASRQGFSLVQPALANQPYLQALEWIPRVQRAERSGYESTALADGMNGFEFTEPAANDAMKLAGQRDEYFPVFYVEPLVGNERAVGYDLASDPVRKAALLQSRDSGNVIATARIKLVQERGDQYGTLVFSPVYGLSRPQNILGRRRALRGFALGVLRIGDFIATTDDTQRRLDASGLVDIHLLSDYFAVATATVSRLAGNEGPSADERAACAREIQRGRTHLAVVGNAGAGIFPTVVRDSFFGPRVRTPGYGRVRALSPAPDTDRCGAAPGQPRLADPEQVQRSVGTRDRRIRTHGEDL